MPRHPTGSMRERRPGTWELRVTSGFREDGTPRKVSRTFHGTEAEARVALDALVAEVGARPNLRAGVTLSRVWAEYARRRGPQLAPKTMRSYGWLMGSLWLPALGGMDVSAIAREDVQRVMSATTRENAAHGRRCLSSVLSWAVRAGLADANPLPSWELELPAPAEPEVGEDEDPFAAIEAARDVWPARVVMEAFPLMRGLPLEPCWLACVGGGLRVEEALALRRMDVRRVGVGGRMVTQLAVHRARPDYGGIKPTKTRGSVRIVAVAEPFGARLWELAEPMADTHGLLCPMSASNQNKRWRGYFEPLSDGPTARHRPKSPDAVFQGRLASLPYLPMSRMRATHATLMQEAGVLDSVNAAVHGHSEAVAYTNYKRPDTTDAAERVGSMLRLVC